MANLWETATADVVHKSITDTLLELEIGKDEEYKRYADYYDGRPGIIEPYFKRRHRETAERFADRPKLSWPICRLIADTHAEALASGLSISIEGDKEAEIWDAIAKHNQIGAFLLKVSQIVSVYGSCVVKPLIYDDGTPQKIIEFEAYPPDTAKLIYERNSMGRSVKRFHGAAIVSGFSLENATVVPWAVDEFTRQRLKVSQRVEYITKDRWITYLDEKITPVSPWGEVWMPTENGINPYGVQMVTLFNGLETHEDFLGASDLHLATYDVQELNDLWSNLVYMHRMYVPVWVLKSDNPDTRKTFKSGIGAGVGIAKDESFQYEFGGVNFAAAMEPIKVALEILYSNAKVPAAAVGLGHLFRDQKASGVAKEYEYKSVIAHANAKQPPFKRAVKDMVKKALTIAAASPPFGQGQRIDPNAEVTVDFKAEIVPSSKAEELERISKEIMASMKSIYTGMIEYYGWGPERAAREIDLIAAEQKQQLVDIGFKDIVDIVQARQELTLSAADRKQAEEELFGSSPGFESDKLTKTTNKEQ